MRPIFPTFAAVTALLLTASPLVALDVDDNGVSDVWQWYFDVPANQDLSLDSDGDGRTNREEAEEFTDPFDINDFLGMHNLLFDQSQGLMSFEASPVFGVDQELEFSFDLEDCFFQNSVVGNPDGSPSGYTVQAFNYEDMFWRLRFRTR